MGVVYYANYLTYFETGRVEYLRAAGADYRSIEDSGHTAAVLEANLRYLSPARFDDQLAIHVRATITGPVRIRFDYRVEREPDGVTLAEGHTTHALLAHGSLKPVRVPSNVRDAITRFEFARARSSSPPSASGV